MADHSLQNKSNAHRLQGMRCEPTEDSSKKRMMGTNSKSNTSSMDTHSRSSGSDGDSDFGSYCKLTYSSEHSNPTLPERQNSKNEERESLLDAQKQTLSPEQIMLGTDTCQSCVNQNYKVDSVVNIDKEIYDQTDPKNSNFSSTSDTDWTVSDSSKTKKAKRACSSCFCTITLSTFFSVLISVSVMVLLFRYLNEPVVMSTHPNGTTQDPDIGQSSAAEMRRQSGFQSFLTHRKSRAQLYLDHKALKVEKKLLWTDQDLQDAFMSHDLSTSTFRDNYGCLVVSEEGFYFIFSKVTFYYSRATADRVLYHSANLIREGDNPRQLSENRYTPPPTEARPYVGNIYWPSILPGYYHLKPNDQVCILVSKIDLVYAAPTHSFLSIYMISND